MFQLHRLQFSVVFPLGYVGFFVAGNRPENQVWIIVAADIGRTCGLAPILFQQALLGGFLFMVPAVILSGFATPIANMPTFVQWLTYANPVRYYLIILRRVFLEGAGFQLLTAQMWPLAVIALITLTLAGWMFRKRMY